MDSLITAAARALATGDPLGALNRVALRDDAPALALRGIAMAQLGDLVRAKALLRRAARAFGPKEAVARARCVVAEAEIALVSRDLGWPAKALDAARATLEEHGDRLNAAYARSLEVRRLLLIGRLDEAERTLAALDPTPLSPASRTVHELVVAGIAIRRLRTKAARATLARAERAAGHARIPALTAEVDSAALVLNTPAARLIASGEERLLLLDESMSRSAAEIVREYGPFAGVDSVHGVTYDGQHVWFAAGDTLIAFDPVSGKTLRSIDVAGHAGTAFDGQHLFQLAEDRIQKIDPKTGHVLATIPAPGGGGDSGLAWAEGTLWVGQYRERKIYQIDPHTGAILGTIESNRFVTGVTWIDGELWHGTWEGDESELRRVDL